MVPNFDVALNLKNNSRTVAAGGPCNWEDGDTWTEFRDVRVQQGSVLGSSSESITVRKGMDAQWWLDVNTSSQFARGPALASAVAIVHKTDGTTYVYSWPDDVLLQ
jgi:hypothetical protein